MFILLFSSGGGRWQKRGMPGQVFLQRPSGGGSKYSCMFGGGSQAQYLQNLHTGTKCFLMKSPRRQKERSQQKVLMNISPDVSQMRGKMEKQEVRTCQCR